MKEYHKIHTLFKRNPETHRLIPGDYSKPEFAYLAKDEWIWTEKIDGINIRVIWQDGKLRFGGRTDKAQIPTFLYDKLNDMFSTDSMNRVFPGQDVCLYGEGFGARIKKGGCNYIKDGVSFVLFDVMVGNWWLKRDDVFDIAMNLGIHVVPTVSWGTLDEMVKWVKDGFNSNYGTFTADGVVARPTVELYGRNGERVITKLKCRDFD